MLETRKTQDSQFVWFKHDHELAYFAFSMHAKADRAELGLAPARTGPNGLVATLSPLSPLSPPPPDARRVACLEEPPSR